MVDEDIFKIDVDSSELNPALELLSKIDKKLGDISRNTDVFSNLGKKGVKRLNDELKHTDSLLDKIFKKLKLTKLAAGLGGIGKSMLTAAGGGALLSLGGLFGAAVMGSQGSVTSTMTAQRLGIGRQQYEGLKYAGEQTGHSEEQLASTLMAVNESLRNPEKWGAVFNATKLNAQDLQKKDPSEALFEIFDAVKNSPLAKRPETLSLLGQNLSQIGINLDDFREILKSGGDQYRKYFSEYLGKWGGKANWQKLDQGDRALVRFQTSLDILSKKVGGALAPAMEQAVDSLGPLLIKFGEVLAALIQKITPEDVERFGNAVAGFIHAFETLFGWMAPKSVKASTKQLAKIQNFNQSANLQMKNKKLLAGLNENTVSEKEINIDTLNINVQKASDAKDINQLTSGIKAQYATQ